MAAGLRVATFYELPGNLVSAWRVSLEERRLGSSSIIIRMSAIRKLAAEAADNGLLAPELAQGISRVKSVKSTGIRVGNWLSQRQAQALLSAPDVTALSVLRDRAILAVLLGCGLRLWLSLGREGTNCVDVPQFATTVTAVLPETAVTCALICVEET
jgi:site-specific recombinase XerC